MIEPGQLRRWKGWEGPDGLFLVLEHEPLPLPGDGWNIMESGCEPYWEAAVHIEKSSEVCNPDGSVVY